MSLVLAGRHGWLYMLTYTPCLLCCLQKVKCTEILTTEELGLNNFECLKLYQVFTLGPFEVPALQLKTGLRAISILTTCLLQLSCVRPLQGIHFTSSFLILHIHFSHFYNWMEIWQKQHNLQALDWWGTVLVNHSLRAHPGCWRPSQERTCRPFPLHSQFKLTPPALSRRTQAPAQPSVTLPGLVPGQHGITTNILSGPQGSEKLKNTLCLPSPWAELSTAWEAKPFYEKCRKRRTVISMHCLPSCDSYAVESGTI